jgi:hypothetical protein
MSTSHRQGFESAGGHGASNVEDRIRFREENIDAGLLQGMEHAGVDLVAGDGIDV